MYRAQLIDNVLPAILANFSNSPIKIQQDNARPHIYPDDADFVAAAQNQGVDLQVVNQEPNSPDHNINDLGFFRSIDALQQEETANSLQELLDIVTNA